MLKFFSLTLAHELFQVAVYNTAIGLFLTALTSYGLSTNLIYSHAIGFSIYGLMRASCQLMGQNKPGWVQGVVGIPLGFVVGFSLATWVNGFSLAEMAITHPQALLVAGATALLFGALGVWHFHDEAQIRTERLHRAEQEAAAVRAELARLQAQIEPHFLFNTLANVIGLIDTQPVAARTMLIDLSSLLRTSLARTRQGEVSLGEELDLLRAYLGIMGVRMGARLAWRIETEEELRAMRLPPLLVQPLVENAIRHGLEPLPEGGELVLRCRREAGELLIEVEDSGRGFDNNGPTGVGLVNVRERLLACYGERAALSLSTHAGGGVCACLRLPLAPLESSCAC